MVRRAAEGQRERTVGAPAGGHQPGKPHGLALYAPRRDGAILGDGGTSRDYTFLGDIVESVRAAMATTFDRGLAAFIAWLRRQRTDE